MKEKCTGTIPENFDDFYVFIPSKKHIIVISEGSEDNLLKEDYKEGYRDYINYTVYSLEDDMPEVDGGMMLLKEYVQTKYKNLSECLPDLMDYIYDDSNIERIILT